MGDTQDQHKQRYGDDTMPSTSFVQEMGMTDLVFEMHVRRHECLRPAGVHAGAGAELVLVPVSSMDLESLRTW
jgi:hypothetical protein